MDRHYNLRLDSNVIDL